MTQLHGPLLVNTIGHSAGLLIFGLFLVLLFRSRGKQLSLLACALGLLWNLTSLAVLVRTASGLPDSPLLAAAGYSVLSLLPGVLLHIALERRWSPLIATGYALCGVAIAMHCSELIWPSVELHQQALWLITTGFGALTAWAVLQALRSRAAATPRSVLPRLLATMCLALFAMGFVHLGSESASHAWTTELLLHHAGIPLAMVILLHDDRFVLLDAVVKFLANFALAGLFVAGVFLLAQQWPVMEWASGNTTFQVLILAISAGLLVAFIWLRDRFETWLSRAVFRQGDVDKWERELAHLPFVHESAFLDAVAAKLGAFFRTRAEVTRDETLRDLRRPLLSASLPALHRPEWQWVEIAAPILHPAEDASPWVVLLGRGAGGRPYLSQDFEALSRMAAAAAHRLEDARQSELRNLALQAELRALQAQINPHFLFNALNTLYGIIPREHEGARATVLSLASIFRYFLRTDRAFVPLAQEIEIVEAYLQIERLRLGKRLTAAVDVEPAAGAVLVPVLSLQPLVENAVKHGVAAHSGAGWVRVEARVSPPDQLIVNVRDSGPGFSTSTASGNGVGLTNVRKRLHMHYSSQANLQTTHGPDGTCVSLRLPVRHDGKRAAAAQPEPDAGERMAR